MPPEVLTYETDDKETMASGSTADFERNSLDHQSSIILKEKCLFPKGIRNANLQETHEALKTRKLIDKRGADQHEVFSCSSVPLIAHRKPWPSSRASGAERMSKHMSKTPQNLQHIEKGDNVQTKALKVGILEWGLLERWKYHQKCVVHGGSKISKSINKKSPVLHTIGSSTKCARSKCKALPQQLKFASLDYQTKQTIVAGHISQFHDPRASTISCVERDKHHDADSGISTDVMGKKQCQLKKEHSHLTAINHISGTSHSASNTINHISALARKIIETQVTRSRNAEKFQDYLPNLDFMGNWQQLYHDSDNIWDHLQESAQKRRNSFESSYLDDGMLMVRKRNSFSLCLLENDKFIKESPHLANSCPIFCASLANEPYTGNAFQPKIRLPTKKSECQNGNQNQFTESSVKQVAVHAAQAGQGEGKAPTEVGRESSNHQSSVRPKWMIRSASLREGSSAVQVRPIDGNMETSSNKGRRSPLRRMFDPFLKLKNNVHFSGPIAASPGRNSSELNENGRRLTYEELASSYHPFKSSNTSSMFTSPTKETANTSNQEPDSSRGSLHHDRRDAQTRQALLQLAWKNGLPLFIFSSSDSDMLASTVTKQNVTDKDDLECIYTIFFIHEYKKKMRAWINLGKKISRHQLVSDVIGRMNVSRLRNYGTKSHHTTREFVLLGAKQITSDGPVEFSFNGELAAIVVKVPDEIPRSCNLDLLQSSNSRYLSPTFSVETANTSCQEKSLPTDHESSNSDICNVVIVLPSGIHGSSTDAKPSPLIERWRSGGTCDCEGWDEGCRLTVLSNKFSECISTGSVQADQTTDDTHGRLELFLQGGSRANGHVFCMASFEEGLYTVEFGTSIASLQAFAICLATLHSRNPNNCSADPKIQGGCPTSYVPHYPPLSPVGRA